jgi:hypothetical protein
MTPMTTTTSILASQLRHLRGQSPPRRAIPQPPHQPTRASQHFIAQFFISLRAPNHQGDDDSEPATGRQRRADSAIPAEEQPSPDHIDLANALRQQEDSDGEDDVRLEEQPGLDHIYLGEAHSNKRTMVAQMR